MDLGIHVLEIEEQQVREARDLENDSGRRQTTGVDRGVEAPFATQVQTRDEEIGLVQRLAAGKRHPAPRDLEEDPIPLDPIDQLLDAVLATHELAGAGRTDFDA
jgi:hypothetical protein